MSALNFPSSPATNQIYSANGKSWRYDGTSWKTYYILNVQGGGTGNTFYNLGDILVGAGTSLFPLPVGNNNYVLTADNTAQFGVSWKVAASTGLTTLNSLSSTIQYFSTGSSGTGFNISSSGSTHTFNIPIAGTGATGLVSTLAQSFAGAKTFTNDLLVTSSTISNSSFTGALTVSGGVGIGGSLFVTSSLPSNLSGVVVDNGVITTGSWAGSTITAYYGGTGYNSYSKGDILVGVGNTFIKLNVGTDSYVLTASSSSPTGLIWSPTAATGITTLNSLTSTIQYFAFGYSGTVPAYSSSGSTHTLNIPLAGSGSTGLISTQAQTIAGQKTFTSAIIGDLTGTATTAGFASTASYSYQAGYGLTSGFATTASYAYQAGYGLTAGFATTASYAYQSGYGITAGFATTAANLNVFDATTNTPHYLHFSPVATGSGVAVSSNTKISFNPATFILSTSGLAVTATTPSISSSTGSLVVSGGVGIGGSLFLTTSLPSNLSGIVVNNGVITNGSWAGNTITAFYGGTGYNSYSKGDILVGAGNTFIKLSAGTDTYVLTASSSSATGLTWSPTAATGITTLNSLTSTQQYFAVGTSGSGFNISSSGSTHTFNIPIAGSGSTGLITTLAQTIAGQKTFTSTIIGDLSGTATSAGYATTAGYAILSGYATTSGIATTAQNINVNNAISNFAHYLFFGSTATGSGVALSSNTTISYNPFSLILSTSGLAVTASTSSISTSTGALVVNGGVGIGGSLYTLSSVNSIISGVNHLNGVITSGSWAGSTITSFYGGTGYQTYSTGDLLAGAGATLIKVAVGTNNFVLVADNTVPGGIKWSNVSGIAITNINGLTASKQDLAFGYSGTIPAFSSSGATHTLNIPLAGTGATGLVSTQSQSFAGIKTFTNDVIISSATSSNSSSTGALTITGGVGIGQSLFTSSSYSSSISGVAHLNGVITSGAWAGSTITSFYGGTGYQTYSTGDLLAGAGSTLLRVSLGTNNFVLVADNTVAGGVKWANISGIAITNINGLTASKQDLAFGYSGTVPAFSSSGSTHTLNIPLAGTGSTGLVSTQTQSFAGIKTFTNAVNITDTTGSGSYTTGALVVSGGVGIGGTLNVQGDLNVQGTFTTINSTTITVADKNIELGVVAVPTDITAQGGGITLRGATDKSINWYSGVGWSSSESWNLASGNTYKINGTTVLSNNTLGTGVIFSSIQTAGIITSGTWSATAITALYGGTGLVPSFTVGDILYANTSNTWGRLTASSNSGYVLASAGSGATPTYVAPSTLSVGFATTAANINISPVSSGSFFPILSSTSSFASGIGASVSNFFSFNAANGAFGATSVNISSTQSYSIGGIAVLSATSLGTGVTNSSLTALGIITTGVWSATAITSFYGGTGYQTYTTGDVLVGAGSTLYKLPIGSNNFVLTADNTVPGGVKWSSVSGLAITNINGLTNTIQYFATGTSGSGFNIASSGSTHTFNIPIAGTGATGLVSTLAQSFAGTKTFTGDVIVSSTTGSTGFNTGALTVYGGLGVSGQLSFNQAALGFTGANNPSMAFIGSTTAAPITLTVLSDNSLLFEGTSGKLFGINNNLSSGWIFNVGDISGLPIIRANADGTVAMAEFAANVGIGLSNPSYKLHVVGDTNLSSGYVYRINGIPVLSSSTLGIGVTNSSLTSVGILNSGVWAATAITSFYGGTGYSTYSTGDLLVGSGSTLYKLPVGTNSYVLTADNTAPGGVKWSVAASTGVTTVNGLTASIQYFSTGTSGNFFNISSSGSTHTFNIPIAGTGSTGLVSTLAQSFAGVKTFTNDTVISSSTASISTSSGALTVTGGVGIGGSLFTGTSTPDSISGVVLNNGVITTGSWSATAITARYGGTGNTTYTLGDLLVGAGSTFIKLPVGINGYVLGADSNRPSGIGWTTVTPLTVSDTPPASPKNADLWFNSADGGLLVYYNDGNTNQWVEIALGSGIDLSQPVHITNTTSATSTSTGALIVDGGAGFASTIYAPVVSINGIYDQISSTLTTSTTTADQVAMTLSATTYRTIKLFVQVTSSTSYHSQEILMVHDGSLVYMTEYAIVNNGSIISTFDADISGGNIRFLVTPTNAVTTYKVACSAMRI